MSKHDDASEGMRCTVNDDDRELYESAKEVVSQMCKDLKEVILKEPDLTWIPVRLDHWKTINKPVHPWDREMETTVAKRAPELRRILGSEVAALQTDLKVVSRSAKAPVKSWCLERMIFNGFAYLRFDGLANTTCLPSVQEVIRILEIHWDDEIDKHLSLRGRYPAEIMNRPYDLHAYLPP